MHSPLTRFRRTIAAILAAASVIVGSMVAASSAIAATAPLPSTIVDGGTLISDAEFYRSGSMSASAVQSFLASEVPTCKAKSGSPTCLKSFTVDVPARAADAYCAAMPKATKARASAVIVAVAKACGINPKVILVMLQKEQGLVTSAAPTEWSYRAAMGQSCPDTAPCSAAAAGFVNQVYLGARQMQIYTKNPEAFRYRAGQTNTILWHPDAGCGTSRVFITNQATANLYNYTPYRPNLSALAAGYGSGDPCSTYGNRNFYNYYVDWFAPDVKTTTGAPSTVSSCRKPVADDLLIPRAGVARIKADATTVRTAPSTACAAGRISAKKGTLYVITGTYAGWLRLKTGDGATLWTFRTNATVIALTPPPLPGPVPEPAPVPAPKPTAKPVPTGAPAASDG